MFCTCPKSQCPNHHPSVRASEAGSPDPSTSPPIQHLPDDPLQLLTRMVDLIRVLVDVLRQKCLDEKTSTERPSTGLSRSTSGVQGRSEDGDSKPGSYSALTQAPEEWRQVEGQPCSGERLLLMFDRWRKLLKAVYNEKKQQFDISKVACEDACV